MSALPIFRAVAVKNSQKFGFTNRAIGAAAKSLDLSPASEAILTPSRLAMEVCKVTNQESIDYLNGIKIESEIEWLAEHHKYSSFKYNVTKGLQAKFVALHPYRHHWPKGLAEMATDPESYCEQIRVMASYIDELCYLSGDTNNDFSFYLKRGIVAGIYKSSMLVFIQDESDQMQETRRFIESTVATTLP